MKVGIIDLGYGNLFTVYKSVKRFCSNVSIISDVKSLKKMDKIIFPGNGSFLACFKKIKILNFLFLLRRHIIKNSIPFLGICLGKQILFNYNYEGNLNGLGLFRGNVKKIKSNIVPHIGWNDINVLKRHSFFKHLKRKTFFFSHSFYVCTKLNVYSTVEYNSNIIPAVFIFRNFFLLQFHPENSSYFGKILIKNFLNDNTSYRYI
ncbi:imidazole glycerol phosphate synthase subunit HisH [Candidatus Vidania fulgoroideorum]